MVETITVAHRISTKMLIEQLQNVWVLFLILQFLMFSYYEVCAQGLIDGLGGGVEDVGDAVKGLG